MPVLTESMLWLSVIAQFIGKDERGRKCNCPSAGGDKAVTAVAAMVVVGYNGISRIRMALLVVVDLLVRV